MEYKYVHVSLCVGGWMEKQGYNWNIFWESYARNWHINLWSKCVAYIKATDT